MTPVLHTKHFTIRAFKADDLQTFADYRAIPAVAQFQSWSDYNHDDAVALFEATDYTRFGVVGHWYQLAIADRHCDKLLGDLALHFIDQQQVEIGFTLDPAHQGKGVAYEALAGLLEYLFINQHKHRVIALTDSRNTPACRLLEKSGFTKEAHYRQNVFFKGAWGDEYLYAMLSAEYRKPD